MNRYGIIYKITNKVNGKVYIGQTINKNGFQGRYNYYGVGIERVYNYHINNKKKNRYYNEHLLSSIEKYGFSNFEVDEEFYVAYSKEELNRKEFELINRYNAIDREYGYNNKEGGGNKKLSKEAKKKISKSRIGKFTGENSANFGKVLSKETKEKISKSKKGKYSGEDSYWFGKTHSEEAKKKISKSRIGKFTGEKNPFYGKTHSEEARRKMSEKASKRTGSKNPKAKKIVLLNTKEIFDTIREASEKYGISEKSISSNCNNIVTYAGNINNQLAVWMFYEEFLKLNDEEVSERLNNKNRYKNTTGYVLLNTKEIFTSLEEAHKKYGANKGSISQCCKGKLKSAGKHPITGEKLVWMYLDEYTREIKEIA